MFYILYYIISFSDILIAIPITNYRWTAKKSKVPGETQSQERDALQTGADVLVTHADAEDQSISMVRTSLS
jgi:hypothetical protein